MRMVKCWDLSGEKRPMKESYKGEDGKYYSSEKGYKKVKEDRGYYWKCVDLFKKWNDLTDECIVPPIFQKKLNELSSYGFQTVYYTMLDKSDVIKWAIDHKDFKDDSSMICYLFAIIRNNINGIKKRVDQQRHEKIIADTKDDMGQEFLQYENSGSTETNTLDISKFLEE